MLLEVEKIEVEQKKTKVYNFSVENFHSYFVSELKIWVHNQKCEVIKNWKGEDVQLPENHIMSPRDPDISEPPIYEEGPFTLEQRNGFLKGNSAGTKLSPHHRHQIPTTQGGVIDEIPGSGHPSGNIHTAGSSSRHPSKSVFNNIEGGKALRQNEISDHWKSKGERLVEAKPGIWIDPGFLK